MRIAICASALFVAVNAALPRLISASYELGYDNRVSSRLAQYDPLTVDDMIASAARLGGRKVWWIGDSIVFSPSRGVTAPQLLEAELRERYGQDIHVFNAALPAARTGDKYAVLLQVLATHPTLVIYETKYLEYSRAQAEGVPFRYPYLNLTVATDPEYARHYQEWSHAVIPLEPPRAHSDVEVDRWINKLLSVVRFRGLVQQILFRGLLFTRLNGGDPGPEIVSRSGPPELGLRPDEELKNPAGRLQANFVPAYRSGPFDAFANPGLFFGRRVAATLDESGVPTVAYLAAINQTLLGDLAADDLLRSNLAIVKGIFTGHRFEFRDYHSDLDRDDLFVDTEHLTLAGERTMVALIVRDSIDLFDRVLRRKGV